MRRYRITLVIIDRVFRLLTRATIYAALVAALAVTLRQIRLHFDAQYRANLKELRALRPKPTKATKPNQRAGGKCQTMYHNQNGGAR